MRADEYRRYDATGLAELVSRKETSAEELLEVAISIIERRNPALNAIIHELYDGARRSIRAGLPSGPFQGVPFALKDLLAASKGAPMTSGSAFFGDWAPPEDSVLVRRFLGAGLVVLGKTNTPEFGLLPVTEPARFGPTRNPWDLARTAGGSSGGSAAAVASGMLPMASGGDGGGSIRIPASCCGIFGFKPSRGRNPSGPSVEVWEGFAQEHVLTRSVRDSAIMLDVTNFEESGAPYFTPPPPRSFAAQLGDRPRRLRIAYSGRPVLGRQTHPDCLRALEDAVKLLSELGHELHEAAPVIDGRAFVENWVYAMGGQVAADIREGSALLKKPIRRAEFHPMTWLSRLLGEALPAAEYVRAVRELKQAGRRLALFLADYDAWLTPTLGEPPVRHGAFDGSGILAWLERLVAFAEVGRALVWSGQIVERAAPLFDFVSYPPLANAGGLPAMSVPLFWNAQRLPIGVMLTARLGEDATLLRLARELEEARPWFGELPPEPTNVSFPSG
jgi:amidase